MIEPRNIPIFLFAIAGTLLAALKLIGVGETAAYAVLGLHGVGQAVFAVWCLSQTGVKRSEWTTGWISLVVLLTLAFVTPPDRLKALLVMWALPGPWLLGQEAANRLWPQPPGEEWPPEQDQFDTLIPRPSPAKTEQWVIFVGGASIVLSLLSPWFLIGAIALMMIRGLFVAGHANWRPMPVFRYPRQVRFGVVLFTAFVVNAPGKADLANLAMLSGLICVLPPILFAASNLGENLGRRWMEYRAR